MRGKNLMIWTLVMILVAVGTFNCGKDLKAPERSNPLDPASGEDPFGVRAHVGSGGIVLEWFSVVLDGVPVDRYGIYRSLDSTGSYSRIEIVTDTTYVDDGVSAGKVFYYKVSAFVGNVESAISHVVPFRIPMGPYVEIAEGAETIASRMVEVTVIAAEAERIWLSNHAEPDSGEWMAFQSSLDWTLTMGPGEKVVYARASYAGGDTAGRAQDMILPAAMGTPSVVIDEGATHTATRDVVVRLECTGAEEMRVWADTTEAAAWRAFQDTVHVTLATGESEKRVYAIFRDTFEIETAEVQDGILPNQPGDGEIVMNDDDPYTNDRNAILTLDCAGVSEMRIAEGTDLSGASWMPFDTTATLTVSTGDGDKQVTAQFRNEFLIETDPISDMIGLDTEVVIRDFTFDADSIGMGETIHSRADCGEPEGNGRVLIGTSVEVILMDDGTGGDETAGDGIYELDWVVDSGPWEGKPWFTFEDRAGNEADQEASSTLHILPVDITVSPDSFSFSTEVAVSLTGTLTIANIGYGTLVAQIESSELWLTAQPNAVSIAKHSHETIMVRVDTTGLDPDPYQADLIIRSNDPDENPVEVDISLQQYGDILVTEPNSSTIWHPGDRNVPIRWGTGDLPKNVSIKLRRPGFPAVTISSSALNNGSYDWDVPSSVTNADDYVVIVWFT